MFPFRSRDNSASYNKSNNDKDLTSYALNSCEVAKLHLSIPHQETKSDLES